MAQAVWQAARSKEVVGAVQEKRSLAEGLGEHTGGPRIGESVDEPDLSVYIYHVSHN